MHANQKIMKASQMIRPVCQICIFFKETALNCKVFDMKNDVFGISLDEDSDEVHVLHSLRSAVLSVSEKESWLIYCYKAVVDVIEHQLKV